MRFVSKSIATIVGVLAMWFVGKDVGINLVSLLLQSDMYFEAIVVGVLSWAYVIQVALNILKSWGEYIEGVH